MDDERLTAIETKLMHLEMQIEDMNGVVLVQAKTIAYLKAKLNEVQGKYGDSDGGNAGITNLERLAKEKPPHY